MLSAHSMMSGSGKDGRKVAPSNQKVVVTHSNHGQDMNDRSYFGAVATFSDFEGRAKQEGLISLRTPKNSDGEHDFHEPPTKFMSKSESSRDFYLNTRAPTRKSFAAALREDQSSLNKLNQLAARLPEEFVHEYSLDVLHKSTFSGSGEVGDGSDLTEIEITRLNAREVKDRTDEQPVEPQWYHMNSCIEYVLANTPRHMSVRLRSKIKLQNSIGGRSWDIFQVVLSLIASLMHILSTYKENDMDDDQEEVNSTKFEIVLELVLSVFFVIDLIIHFYVCDDRIWFFVQRDTVVDILTLAPVAISLGGTSMFINTSFLRALRILRAMRILRAFRVTKNSLSAVDQKVATLVIIVVSIIFMSACLVQTLEKNNGLQDFGVALYFVVVTISTVGYGDYSPVTFEGRLVVCVMIIGFMVIVPVKISELADLLAMRSPWYITYHSKPGYRNILLIGSVLEVAEVEAFLEEFFHPDRMRLAQDISLPSTDLVIMAPHDPSEAMVALLFVPFWQGQVYYVNGSALDDRDLKRAGARTADACFVLIGKRSSPPRSLNDHAEHQELIDHYDSQNVLYALMVENFNHHVDTFVQVRGLEKRYSLSAAEADVVMCIDRLRMCILGSTAIYPGLCAFMGNLWQSSSEITYIAELDDEDDDDFEEGKEEYSPRKPKIKVDWKEEYLRARSMEIYVRPVLSLFAGLTFNQAAFIVNRAFDGGITLMGVEERLNAYEDYFESQDDVHEPHVGSNFRILRSLVAPGDSYVFPNCGHVNKARADKRKTVMSPRMSMISPTSPRVVESSFRVERLEVHAYFLCIDADLADMFCKTSSFAQNILHSFHEFVFLRSKMAPPVAKLQTTVETEETEEYEDERGRGAPYVSSQNSFDSLVLESRVILTASEFKDHYIIMAPPASLASIQDCLIPLRGGEVVTRPETIPRLCDKVVILINKLDPKTLPQNFLRMISTHRDVFVVFGDHNVVSDLRRAGIMTCKSIIILEDNQGMATQGSEINTSTITKFLSTEQCLTMAAEENDFIRRPRSYVVETNSKATMAIMNRSVLNRMAQEKIRNSVMSEAIGNGTVSAIDVAAVAAQVRIKQRELRAKDASNQEKLEEMNDLVNTDMGYTMTPFFAAGSCFSTSVFDNLLVLSYFARGVLRFTEALLGLESAQKKVPKEELLSLGLDPSIKSGQIIQIPIPVEHSHGKKLTYTQIFDLMLIHYEAVVVGVFRAGGHKSEMPFIGLPKPSDTVEWNDALFVVAPPHQIEKLLQGATLI